MVVAVWALTALVLGLGIATLSPILLLWGAIGLPGAIFLTRIHVRDTRQAAKTTDTTDIDVPAATEATEADADADLDSKETPR